MRISKFQKYIGSKIHKLYILKILPERKNDKTWFLCRCDCGGETIVNASKLVRGVVSGCQKCKNRGKYNAKWNGFGELSGTYWKNLTNCASTRDGDKAEFKITKEFAWNLFEKQNRKCALSGLPIEFAKDSYSRGTASLDRIDSSKGYIEGNLQWLHKDVNRMKTDLSEERFIELCNLISKNLNMKNNIEVLEQSKNAIFTIFPYKQGNVWMFDDKDRNVFKEPFVAGADTFLDVISQGKKKVGIIFSGNPFPDANFSLGKVEGEVNSGTTYYSESYQHELWLCPCLGVYFSESPDRLFIKVIPQENEQN